ncbi:snapalysin family zinc-dependent metalloprotease [Marinitenerispora sediminis]|uniref:Extracellular small neutral protease n=1 Tax=Marinitenerispora sediminis TaxID=1931232 RepID=A0A368T014_9ACTN|nr:snapalysin family zinc-dependent metalloprotease [Marinitenerispora sediminis]RCV49489.1 metalloprotease [Marinitenerispora sediminis]RCV52172.1 metalloprotease [Marinitenerispora sediminis]RCV53748.1 metalloprotease [Marinitenerispora sediminis]
MLRRRSLRPLIAATAAALALFGGTTTAAAATGPADPAAAQATTLYYDDSQAAEFRSAVAAGVQVWNDNVSNVHLVRAPAGQRAQIVILASDGWPQANLGPVRPGGQVRVWMGRQGVEEGYDPVRIAAHELGHSLGLPDIKPGPCSSLMSGSTAGTSCTNAVPNATERARVEANYSGTLAHREPADGRVLVDAP